MNNRAIVGGLVVIAAIAGITWYAGSSQEPKTSSQAIEQASRQAEQEAAGLMGRVESFAGQASETAARVASDAGAAAEQAAGTATQAGEEASQALGESLSQFGN